MQALERTTAMFCMACICAELVSHFVGQGWGRKCIKVVAGLYILVVLAETLSGTKTQLSLSVLPQAGPVSVGTMEDAVLTQAEEELAEILAEKCFQETGNAVTLTIKLVQTADGVNAECVTIRPREEPDAVEKQETADFLAGQLQISPEKFVWELPGGEDVP